MSLVHSTVVGNSADVAFSNIDSQQLMSFGSVVAGGVATQDSCLGTPTSFGYNFSDDLSCGFTQPTDRQDAGSPRARHAGQQRRTDAHDAARPPPVRSSTRSRGQTVKPTAPPVSPPTRAGSPGPRAPGCDIGAVEAQIVVPVVPVVPLTPGAAGADRDRSVVHRLTRAQLGPGRQDRLELGDPRVARPVAIEVDLALEPGGLLAGPLGPVVQRSEPFRGTCPRAGTTPPL